MRLVFKSILSFFFCVVVVFICYAFFGDWRRTGVDVHAVLLEFIDFNDADGAIYAVEDFIRIGGGVIIYDIRLKKDPVEYFLENGFNQDNPDAGSDWIPEYFRLKILTLHLPNNKIYFGNFDPKYVFSKDSADRNAQVFVETIKSDSNRVILIIGIP